MPEGRPAVPAALRRALLEEAGYRCAVPTCRAPNPLELAHIEPWSSKREHSFDNMIVLCRNDHFRFDHDEIPVQAIRVYKSNLAVLNGRYSELERRMLEQFAEDMDARMVFLRDASIELGLRNLVRDGLVLVERADSTHQVVTVPWNPIEVEVVEGALQIVEGTGHAIGGHNAYTLTSAGRDLVLRWSSADLILNPPTG